VQATQRVKGQQTTTTPRPQAIHLLPRYPTHLALALSLSLSRSRSNQWLRSSTFTRLVAYMDASRTSRGIACSSVVRSGRHPRYCRDYLLAVLHVISTNPPINPSSIDLSMYHPQHYFQAMKFAGTPHEEEVRRAKSPGDAAALGRNRSLPLRRDWEEVKEGAWFSVRVCVSLWRESLMDCDCDCDWLGIMEEVLLAKFTQHAELKQTLLDTGDATLVEHTENDSYWGDGGDGSGRNRLGILLMKVRERIRTEQL